MLDRQSRVKIGSFFKVLRLENNLSQDNLAKALGYTNSQFVSNWERGLAHPPLKKVKRLTKILKGDASQIKDLYKSETINSMDRFFNAPIKK